jgi:hypothetical protein
MPDWDMDVYTASTSVEMTISWPSHEDYQRARELLVKMGADCGPPAPGRKKPEFFYLEDEQQLRSLLELRKSLSGK